jgi:hypothetical protein
MMAIIWLALILYFFSGVRHYVPDVVYSGDREKVVVPTINYNKQDKWTYLCVNLEVRDTQSGKTLFMVQTQASDRMKWSVFWVGTDIIRLDSADIGSFCWKEESEKWGETKCP